MFIGYMGGHVKTGLNQYNLSSDDAWFNVTIYKDLNYVQAIFTRSLYQF